ncbi:MAG: TraB/GumN family protein [Halanaerobiaceae bacterium]
MDNHEVENDNDNKEYDNVERIKINEKEIILIGTAHVSKKSAEQVKEIIENEKPDSVCVELDQGRYSSIKDEKKWQETDIFKIIKGKKVVLLLVNLIIGSFQKKIAKQFGIQAGQEMIQGIKSAEENDAKLILADRNIQVTFKRIWRGLGILEKFKLMFQILTMLFVDEEITEDEMEKLKSGDSLHMILSEMANSFPGLKKHLIDERDQYLSYKIKNAPGNKVVAVLGAGHIPGILEEIYKQQNIAALTKLPPKSKIGKIITWSIPVIIISIIIYTFFTNRQTGIDQALSWIIWNGSLSALGTLIARGHILSIITAFIAAPISSLNPAIAAGWFAGIVEGIMRKPQVKDFQDLTTDLSFKGFWSNKVTRVLLVVVFANLGSVLGTAIGGADVIRRFLELFA